MRQGSNGMSKSLRCSGGRALFTVVVSGIALLGGVGSTAHAQAVPFGVNDGGFSAMANETRYHDDIAGVGARLHRYTLSWAGLQPDGPYFNAGAVMDYDRWYQADLARGVRPVYILHAAPGWAQDAVDKLACTKKQKWLCAVPPGTNHLGAWQAFARWAALRYPEAAAFEIWNEPNLKAFWQTPLGPNPARYAEIATTAAAAIHEVAPDATVLLSGPSGKAENDGNGKRWDEFLYAVLENGGAAGADAISLHPYINNAANFPEPEMISFVSGAVAMLASMGTPIPAWITETGVSAKQTSPANKAVLDVALINLWMARSDVQAVLLNTMVSIGASEGYQMLTATKPLIGPMRVTPTPSWCAVAIHITGVCPEP